MRSDPGSDRRRSSEDDLDRSFRSDVQQETNMTTKARLALAAVALAASFNLASAQTGTATDPHHPADTGPAQGLRPPMPPAQRPMAQTPNQPGAMPMKPGGAPAGQDMMMGGDMMKMMGMMQMMQGGMSQMGMGPAGMRGLQHIEGQIAFYKAELKITDVQAPQWKAFEDAIRSSATTQRTALQGMMQATAPGSAPEQIERRIALTTAELDAMKTFLTAVKPLYAVLSDEQKKTADELMAEHLTQMRPR
jgi:hypothetical protein